MAHVVDVAQVAYPKIPVVEIGEPIKNIDTQDELLNDAVDINTSIPLINNLDKVDTGVSVC